MIRKSESVHWVMTQYLSSRAVLGEPFPPDHWGAAMVSTEVDYAPLKVMPRRCLGTWFNG